MATLTLQKRPRTETKAAPTAPPVPSVLPVLDRNDYFVTDISMAGTTYTQGTHVFAGNGQYLRETDAPAVLSPQERQNFRRDKAKQKQSFARIVNGAAQVPQKVFEMARENAQALAAERYAE